MLISPRESADLDFPDNVQLHPSPPDWRDQFIYFLLVDRFQGQIYPFGFWRERDPQPGLHFTNF